MSNTTIERPQSLLSEHKKESGGLSGRPLKEKSTSVLRKMSTLLKGSNIVLIGVGGVESGRDALDKIKAGASLIQVYSAMTYDGPTLISRINEELIEQLKQEGFATIGDAIGADLKGK